MKYTKYVIAILTAASSLLVLGLTGGIEILVQNEVAAWVGEIIFSLLWVTALLYLENRINPENSIVYNLLFLGISVLADIAAFPLAEYYLTSGWYDRLNPWNDTWLRGIHWVVYLYTICGAQILWLLIRAGIYIFRIKRSSQ